MKKIVIILAIICACVWQANCQQYFDAVIIKNQKDTIFGKIVNITDSAVVVDRFNVIFEISKENIENYISNYREMTPHEQALMQQIDNIYNTDLGYKTAGYYLRKSARNFSTGLPIFAIGTTTFVCSLTLCEDKPPIKYVLLASGCAAIGTGVFFLLRSFHFINKTGKILDMEKASLYVAPSTQNDIGVQLKF